ncbi:MAG: NUDIX domain-containing protein [Clostridia bacterium]|jgi:isopentenyl-diphosphate delta-isomerase type 1|nr:NUDIX domain-containing protein [Clostridia bacterium]
MEYVDILNENGILTGEVLPKKEAHRLGLWHKAVHIFIVNNNDELLIQKRASDKDFYPNVWDLSAAGHISADETSLISAIREIEEEIGISVKEEELKYLFTIREEHIYEDINNKEFLDVFFIKKNIDSNNLKLQVEEVADAKFISIEEFETLVKKKDTSIFPHYEEFQMFIDLYRKM